MNSTVYYVYIHPSMFADTVLVGPIETLQEAEKIIIDNILERSKLLHKEWTTDDVEFKNGIPYIKGKKRGMWCIIDLPNEI